MISIDRLEEMAIEELETKLNNWKEQVELQSNFIDSLLKATNNSEWLNKTILDDEASEIIEKIELDYAQLDQLKAENDRLMILKDKTYFKLKEEYLQHLDQLKAENKELKKQHQADKGLITSTGKQNYQLLQEYDKLKNCLTKIKDIAKRCGKRIPLFEIDEIAEDLKQILQKISEVEDET